MTKNQHNVVQGNAQGPYVPPQVNGFDIIAEFATPKGPATRAGRVIIVDRGEKTLRHRYVTAWQGREGPVWDNEWSTGHYFNEIYDALDDFAARARRNF